jgi:hypothetical protein
MTKPKVHFQGKIIVESEEPGFLIMFPDGCIVYKKSKSEVERAAKRYWKKHADGKAVNVGLTEWRNCYENPEV